jgi:hypothetical protein
MASLVHLDAVPAVLARRVPGHATDPINAMLNLSYAVKLAVLAPSLPHPGPLSQLAFSISIDYTVTVSFLTPSSPCVP